MLLSVYSCASETNFLKMPHKKTRKPIKKAASKPKTKTFLNSNASKKNQKKIDSEMSSASSTLSPLSNLFDKSSNHLNIEERVSDDVLSEKNPVKDTYELLKQEMFKEDKLNNSLVSTNNQPLKNYFPKNELIFAIMNGTEDDVENVLLSMTEDFIDNLTTYVKSDFKEKGMACEVTTSDIAKLLKLGQFFCPEKVTEYLMEKSQIERSRQENGENAPMENQQIENLQTENSPTETIDLMNISIENLQTENYSTESFQTYELSNETNDKNIVNGESQQKNSLDGETTQDELNPDNSNQSSLGCENHQIIVDNDTFAGNIALYLSINYPDVNKDNTNTLANRLMKKINELRPTGQNCVIIQNFCLTHWKTAYIEKNTFNGIQIVSKNSLLNKNENEHDDNCQYECNCREKEKTHDAKPVRSYVNRKVKKGKRRSKLLTDGESFKNIDNPKEFLTENGDTLREEEELMYFRELKEIAEEIRSEKMGLVTEREKKLKFENGRVVRRDEITGLNYDVAEFNSDLVDLDNDLMEFNDDQVESKNDQIKSIYDLNELNMNAAESGGDLPDSKDGSFNSKDLVVVNDDLIDLKEDTVKLKGDLEDLNNFVSESNNDDVVILKVPEAEKLLMINEEGFEEFPIRIVENPAFEQNKIVLQEMEQKPASLHRKQTTQEPHDFFTDYLKTFSCSNPISSITQWFSRFK